MNSLRKKRTLCPVRRYRFSIIACSIVPSVSTAPIDSDIMGNFNKHSSSFKKGGILLGQVIMILFFVINQDLIVKLKGILADFNDQILQDQARAATA